MRPPSFNTRINSLRCALPALWWLLLSIAAAPVAWAGDGAAVAAQARAMLDQGRGETAWALLAPREPEHAGEFAFDYALGMVAVDTGRYDRAIFALERAVVTDRRHVGARLELARAYIGQGNLTRAGLELDRVEELTDNPRALAVVERYRDAIERRHRAERRTRPSGHVQFGLGHDTNITVQPDDPDIDPGEIDDNFWTFSLRGRVDHDLDAGRVFYVQGDWDEHRHLDEDDWDYRQWRGRVGVTASTADGGHWDASMRFGVYRHELEDAAGDSPRDRNTVALAGLHRMGTAPGGLDGLTFFGQAARVTFPDQSGDTGDTNLFLLGVVPEWVVAKLPAWIRVTGVPGGRTDALSGAVFSITAVGGFEQETGGRVDGDRILAGGQARVRWPAAPGWLVDVGGGLQQSWFSDARPDESRREDRLISASARAVWAFERYWTFRPELRYAKNLSNLDESEYDRTELLLHIRRVF